jgi:dipeptidyl aminopeptidase/acylaminoacyl peptidase
MRGSRTERYRRCRLGGSLLVALLAAATCSGSALSADAHGGMNAIPDIETFMQIGAAGEPILSSDGERLFFVSAMSGTPQLYRVLPQGWPYQLTFLPDGVRLVSFSDDCRHAVVGSDSGGNEQYQLSLIDTETGALRILTSDPARHIGPLFSRDGRFLYYSANEPDSASFSVHEMDLSNGAARLLFAMTGSSVASDVSPDGGRILIHNTVTSHDFNLYVVNLADLSQKLITPHTGERNYGEGAFSADGQSVYALTDDNPQGVVRLARIDLGSGKREFPFAGDPRWGVEAFDLSTDGRFLAYVVDEDGYGRVHLRDLKQGIPLPVPEADGIVTSPACTDSGYLAYAFSSPTRTEDVWIWNFRAAAGLDSMDSRATTSPLWTRATANPVQVTFSSYAGIDPALFREPSLVRFRSFDGKEIPAFLYLPPEFAGRPVPFIIEAHGGPALQFRPDFNRHFQYLMQHGFGILAPNFRGSSGYGRDFEEADNYRKRLDAVKDVAAGAQWLIDQGYARKGGIGIKGASYGGYLTLAAMTWFPELFAAGFDQVGIADFASFLSGTAAYRRGLRESEYGPLSDKEFLRSISPIHKVDRIRGALMVVHGENDPRVPVTEARQILRAVRAHGTPVDSLIFTDEGHGITKRSNQLVFYRRMVDFFERYLGAGARVE